MRNFSKNLKVLLTLVLISVSVAAVCLTASASELTDIKGHWSQQYVEYGVDAGYINGYPDSTFKPDNPVTRAEFVKMVNSALGITRMAEISFFDIEKTDWFYEDVRKATYAGYVTGYENGAFIASNLITRQEAAVILSRIATRNAEDKSISSFKDAKQVADWALGSFEFAYAKGFLTGDDLGNLLPTSSLTRGQAAKILHTLRTTENIYNGNYTVGLDKALISETIFTDDVIFTSDAEDAALTLDGCRVLGTVNVKAENDSEVVIKETNAQILELSGGHHTVLLSDGATIKNATLKSPADISGTGLSAVYISGVDMISGPTDIDMDIETLVISSGAVVKAKDVESLQVNGKASLTLQGMTVNEMKVLSGASGSVITLAENVTVEDLEVSAPVSFMGTGTIEKAVNKVSGVTYETKPESLSGITSSEDEPDDEPENENSFKPSYVYPSNGAVNVNIEANITVSFENNIYKTSGATLTSSYLEDCFELRRSSTTGTKIEFTPILSNEKSITIYPKADFANGTKYYLILKSGVLADGDGNTNAKSTYSFTTKEAEKTYITFSPANGKTSVDSNSTLKITFSSAVNNKNGSKLTEEYLSETAIELRERSLSGTPVEITATINSTNKVVTVKPETILKADTKYYLIVNSGCLEYADGKSVAKEYAVFTTSDKLAYSVTPANAVTGVSADSEIVLEFNTEIYRPSGSNVTTSYLTENIQLRKSSTNGTQIEFTAVISSDRKSVTLIPSELEAGTKYYVIVPAGVIASESGSENTKISSYFTVAATMTPIITPENNETGVSPSGEIVIKFTEPLFDASKNEITAEYVEEKVVTLRRNSSTGTKLDFEAQISSDFSKITITPVNGFASNSTYYVAVTKNTLFNEAGKGNTAATSTFKTAYSSKPDFLPYNGEENVDVKSNIEIVFDTQMYAIGGATLTTTYIKNNVVELYEGNEDGKAVDFSVSLSSDKHTITINPTKDLSGNTEYLVVVRKSSLEDASGNENPMFSSAFTTKEKVSTAYTVTPANASTKIALNTPVKIQFESAVYRTNGNIASSAYIVNNAVELRKGSSGGNKVVCTATISDDNKTIILTPEEPLASNTKYYVKIVAGTLAYSDKTAVPAKSSYFTTNDGTPIINSFVLKETGASYAVFDVVSGIDGTIRLTVKDSEGNTFQSGDITVSAGIVEEVTIKGLASSTSYTGSVYVEDSEGKKSSAKAVSLKTEKSMAAEIAADDIDPVIHVTVKAYCAGTVHITYTDAGETVTVISGLMLDENEERKFDIKNLESGKKYTVKVEFTDEASEVYSVSGSATTVEAVEIIPEITKITVATDTEDTYSAAVKDGKATLTITPSSYVKIIANTNLTGEAEVYYGEQQKKALGEYSDMITVTPGSTYEAVVKVIAHGKTVECTVTININE